MIRAILIGSCFYVRILTGALLAGTAWAAPADSAHSYSIQRETFGRWFPSRITLGPQAGILSSRLRSTGEYRSFLLPVPARDRAWLSPSIGASLSVRWRNGFNLSLSPRTEAYGLQTREDTVAFAGNPYPHTLDSRIELEYNVWPILAGFDWALGKHRFRIEAGLYEAFMSRFSHEWKVDGEPYANHPPVLARESLAGALAAAEYGFRWGPGDWTMGLGYQRAFDSALEGLNGSVRTEAFQLRMGYAWELWRRNP